MLDYGSFLRFNSDIFLYFSLFMARKILFKTVTYKPTGEDQKEYNYRKEIIAHLQFPSDPRVGMDIAEMREALPILDKLEAAKDGEEFIFENSEHKHILDKLESVRMNKLIRPLIQLIDDFKNAEEFQVKESKKE